VQQVTPFWQASAVTPAFSSTSRTCRTTVNSSRTWDIDISGLPTSTCVSCRGLTDWRQEFLCSRTTAMEQPTDRDPDNRHYVRTL